MIPISVEDYFDDYEVCVKCCSMVYYPCYLNLNVPVCRSCFEEYCQCAQCRLIVRREETCLDRTTLICLVCMQGYETEQQEAWSSYCGMEEETQVCY